MFITVELALIGGIVNPWWETSVDMQSGIYFIIKADVKTERLFVYER